MDNAHDDGMVDIPVRLPDAMARSVREIAALAGVPPEHVIQVMMVFALAKAKEQEPQR